MNKCLYCYLPLNENEQDFHAACSRQIFGDKRPPVLPFDEKDIESLASRILHTHTSVPGVQPKLSLHLHKHERDNTEKRFTIVGLWGSYILKPPTPQYPELPETEDLTMHLATSAGIRTAPHSLIRLTSGHLAYLTKRMDRSRENKLAMEDMCQLTERLTENKYHGSYEQIAKTILKYSATPGLDLVNFFELIVFSFLTGNADMHLKNFSLLEHPGLGMTLSPAYDLVNTTLVNPADDEEMALTLNGKKKKLKKQDFTMSMENLQLDPKQQQNIFTKMEKAIPAWNQLIERSFLSPPLQSQYKSIIAERAERLL